MKVITYKLTQALTIIYKLTQVVTSTYHTYSNPHFTEEELRVMKSLKLVLATAVLMTVSATASAEFSTAPCKACHTVDRDLVGPAWKTVAEKYGNAETLAKVFKSGFKVEDRKIAMSEPKFKKQAATMTGMFNSKIKGHEDEAAKALFDAVKSGKM
jgi:cytochrome c551/c552